MNTKFALYFNETCQISTMYNCNSRSFDSADFLTKLLFLPAQAPETESPLFF